MSAHTPGPWSVEPLGAPKSTHLISAQVGDKRPLICSMEHSRSGPIDHAQAAINARLIAAAPDLYMALGMLMDTIAFKFSGEVEQELAHKAMAKVDAA